MRINPLPPVEFLRERFAYNPVTGEVTHAIEKKHNARAGDVAGCLNSRGYRIIKVAYNGTKKSYLASRIAWALHTGEVPDVNKEIDHINRDKDDNRIDNLRLVSRANNMKNRRAFGEVKVKGVHKHRHGFTVHLDGEYKGFCKTLEEAMQLLQFVTTL